MGQSRDNKADVCELTLVLPTSQQSLLQHLPYILQIQDSEERKIKNKASSWNRREHGRPLYWNDGQIARHLDTDQHSLKERRSVWEYPCVRVQPVDSWDVQEAPDNLNTGECQGYWQNYLRLWRLVSPRWSWKYCKLLQRRRLKV